MQNTQNLAMQLHTRVNEHKEAEKYRKVPSVGDADKLHAQIDQRVSRTLSRKPTDLQQSLVDSAALKLGDTNKNSSRFSSEFNTSKRKSSETFPTSFPITSDDFENN